MEDDDQGKNCWTLPRWTPYITSTVSVTGTARGVTGNVNLLAW